MDLDCVKLTTKQQIMLRPYKNVFTLPYAEATIRKIELDIARLDRKTIYQDLKRNERGRYGKWITKR